MDINGQITQLTKERDDARLAAGMHLQTIKSQAAVIAGYVRAGAKQAADADQRPKAQCTYCSGAGGWGAGEDAEECGQCNGTGDQPPAPALPRRPTAVMAGDLSEFAPYLKEGETPFQRLQREIKDSGGLSNLLVKERARFEFLHSTNSDAEGWEWGVARVRRAADGRIEYLWGLSDHSDIDAAMGNRPPAMGAAHLDSDSAAELIILDVCEMDPADPDLNDTVCIDVSDLLTIVKQHVGQLRPTASGAGDLLADEIVDIEMQPITNEGRATTEEEFGYFHDGYCAGFLAARHAAYLLVKSKGGAA